MAPQTETEKSTEIFAPAADVESVLSDFLDERPLPANLRDAIRYSLLDGGKRLRPILVVRSCEAVGGDPERAYPAAGALEMIHAFSLIHDDLPAMDDDDLRRGKPTLHRHTNEAMAILAGDGLTSLAFELILTKTADPTTAAALAGELGRSTTDMIAGQVYDTLGGFEPGLSEEEKLRAVHRHKTAALLRGACRMGAICGEADEATVERLTDYGEAVGLMFQVIDDILDVTQTTEHLGKAAGKDEDAGKRTYPGILGLEASREEVDRLSEKALDAIAPFGEAAQPLRDLCEYMAVRTK